MTEAFRFQSLARQFGSVLTVARLSDRAHFTTKHSPVLRRRGAELNAELLPQG